MDNLLPSFDAIVFDMDGVIFDSERISWMNWEKAGREFKIEGIAETVKECTGRSYKDTLDILHDNYGPDFPAQKFRNRISELYWEYVKNNGLPFKKGALECLEYLRIKGYRLALASSTRSESVERELRRGGIRHYFEHVVAGDMVKKSKPDPEIYLKACSLMNVQPENCLAVEDSPNGIASAWKAGMKCLMVVDQIQPSDTELSRIIRLCSSLEELKEFL